MLLELPLTISIEASKSYLALASNLFGHFLLVQLLLPTLLLEEQAFASA